MRKKFLYKNMSFYHTIDIPGHGVFPGEWDLRGNEDKYLGEVDLKGKKVLEVGAANGGLCFYMEKKGAKVIAFNLSEKEVWDVVPFAQYNYKKFLAIRKKEIKKLNNAFLFGHEAFQSKSKVVYGSVYSLPKRIGRVDISTFGCILLHLRDPFLALKNVLQITKEKVIITEVLSIRQFSFLFYILSKFAKPSMQFLPDYRKVEPKEAWWYFNPEVLKKFIGVLGFEKTDLKWHFQKYKNRKRLLFTIIGYRTRKI